jgi:hypothetical protein
VDLALEHLRTYAGMVELHNIPIHLHGQIITILHQHHVLPILNAMEIIMIKSVTLRVAITITSIA